MPAMPVIRPGTSTPAGVPQTGPPCWSAAATACAVATARASSPSGAAVRRYASRGYAPIRIYSSVKPELVPVIVDEAHRLGLRVGGHVPAFMTAEQFVRAGVDEIQHVDFPFLNFWADSVPDTRTMARVTELARRGASLDLDGADVRRLVALLRERGTVVDPTLNVFEHLLVARGHAAPRVRGGGGARAADAAVHARRPHGRAAGVRARPRAGAVRTMRLDRELGTIARGKLADLIVVDGDPLRGLAALRDVRLVVKNGVVYDASALRRAIGLR